MGFQVGDRVKYLGGYSPIRGQYGTVGVCENTWERYVKFDNRLGNYKVGDLYLAKISSFGMIHSFNRIYGFPYSK